MCLIVEISKVERKPLLQYLLSFCVFLLTGASAFALDEPQLQDPDNTNVLNIGFSVQSLKKVDLKGPWEFFPSQLIQPSNTTRSQYLTSAGKNWDQEEKKFGINPVEGFATYKIRFSGLDHRVDGYEIAIRSVSSSYSAYLYLEDKPDEAIRFQNGVVGRTKADSIPQMVPRIVSFKPAGPKETWVLLIQLSNFYYGKSGLWVTPEIAKDQYLSKVYQLEHESYLISLSLIFVMGLYSLIFFIQQRNNKIFFYLCLFCFVAFCRAFAAGYFLSYYLTEASSFLYSVKFWMEYIAIINGPVFYLLFIELVFELRISKTIQRLHIAFGAIVSAYITIVGPVEYSQHLSKFQVYACLTSASIIFILYRAAISRKPGAKYALCATLILGFGLMYDIAISHGLLSYPYLNQYCTCVFIFMQGIVVSERYKSLNHQKSHAFSEMAKMVYPHQLIEIKNGQVLESTMPTMPSEACVISFDIVGSSKIRHINAKKFFRNTFTRCNEIISEGYDGKSLKANAYRIKEMGDGFLCSVGYPFQSMTENSADEAIDLARRFAQVLAQEAKILHSDTPISCGIGIAIDSLSGFYPEAGTKEYDLYGPALILATRYEGMRKILCPDGNRSVLIIQEKVYKSLNPSHRKGFVEHNLKQQGIVVRDDSAATHIYLQYLEESQDKSELPSNVHPVV